MVKKDSTHLIGLAVDIVINNGFTRLILIASAIEVGIKRIGIAKDFIHIDTDSDKDNAIWVY